MNPLKESDRDSEYKIYELKPGMKLGSGIYTSKGAMLLSFNIILSQDSIDKIASYNKIDPIKETV